MVAIASSPKEFLDLLQEEEGGDVVDLAKEALEKAGVEAIEDLE